MEILGDLPSCSQTWLGSPSSSWFLLEVLGGSGSNQMVNMLPMDYSFGGYGSILKWGSIQLTLICLQAKMWKLEVPTRILILQIEGGIACFLGSRAVINLGYSIPKMVEELPICVGNPNNTSDSLRESRQDWARSSAPRCFGTFWSQPYGWGCSF